MIIGAAGKPEAFLPFLVEYLIDLQGMLAVGLHLLQCLHLLFKLECGYFAIFKPDRNHVIVFFEFVCKGYRGDCVRELLFVYNLGLVRYLEYLYLL